jgi:hypothetical protein
MRLPFAVALLALGVAEQLGVEPEFHAHVRPQRTEFFHRAGSCGLSASNAGPMNGRGR